MLIPDVGDEPDCPVHVRAQHEQASACAHGTAPRGSRPDGSNQMPKRGSSVPSVGRRETRMCRNCCAGLHRLCEHCTFPSPCWQDALETLPPGSGGEIQLTDALAHQIGEPGLFGCRFGGKRFDCGNNNHVAVKQLSPLLPRLVRVNGLSSSVCGGVA